MPDLPSSDFDSILATARTLEVPAPQDRAGILRGDAALLVDGLLTRVAREHGAIDVAIGEALHTLAQGDRVLRLGFSGVGDYARERLGIAPSSARAMVRLSQELVVRPKLASAVRKGEVTARKAYVVLPVALGDDEEHWIERARRMTVRQLEASVRATRASGGAPDEGPWSQVEVSLSEAQRKTVDRALELARKVIGHAAPRWELVEAICEEYLSEHPEQIVAEGDAAVLRFECRKWLEAAKAGLEHETARWAALEEIGGMAALEADSAFDPFSLDQRLRDLVDMRARRSDLIGHLGLVVRVLGLWRDMGFVNFAHYCTERLQMSVRTVEQRVALERRLYAFPELRQALAEKRISYEKARIVARHASERTVHEWLERAERMTCVELSRQVSAEADAQMCSRGVLIADLPPSATSLLDAACDAVRRAEGRWMAAGDCLERIARHFIDTWESALRRRSTAQTRVWERDGGWCRVPGCSRAGDHIHHIVFRSQGGSDDPENLVTLCATHHLKSIHEGGFIRVEGLAPDGLTWELGLRPGLPPLLVFAA